MNVDGHNEKFISLLDKNLIENVIPIRWNKNWCTRGNVFIFFNLLCSVWSYWSLDWVLFVVRLAYHPCDDWLTETSDPFSLTSFFWNNKIFTRYCNENNWINSNINTFMFLQNSRVKRLNFTFASHRNWWVLLTVSITPFIRYLEK